MPKGPAKSLAAIQRLIAERVEIERWLGRLDLAGDKTPEPVRDRVKSDYETRLKQITQELAGHGDELAEALRRQRLTREGLARQEKEAAERLAEAEVRHAVGEYDESKWRELNADHLGTLAKIREALKNAEEEIGRLEEVVTSLEAPPAPAPQPPPEIPPEPAAAASAAGSSGRPHGKKASVDELAFLKSVTEDEKHGPSAARAGAVQRIPESPPAEPAPPPAPAAEAPPRRKVDVGAAGAAAIDSSGPGKELTGKIEKTLKCKECGTMNLPTEWYCEKCGAEITQI